MRKNVGWLGVLALFSSVIGVARADQTTIGISINGTTGHHVESQRIESIPLLPLPVFEIDHVHRDFRIHLEAVPPIGPVPLAQQSQFAESLSPRVSYLTGELLYEPRRAAYSFGIGETILNQETQDHVPFLRIQPAEQFSRVVGARFIAAARLYATNRGRLQASLAFNPSMQGLQNGLYPERASLVDGQMRWISPGTRFDVSYGIRYINYAAAYAIDHSLADRNHLFMPFVGIDWYGKRAHRGIAGTSVSPVHLDPRRTEDTTLGLTFFGSNGNRTATGAYSDIPLNFVLIPDISLEHRFGRYEIDGELMRQNANSNPFGSSAERWSYVSVRALRRVGDRVALGVGETVTNLKPVRPPSFYETGSRSSAIDFVSRLMLARGIAGRSYVELRLEPYVHVSSFTTVHVPLPRSFFSTAHGARVDGIVKREINVRRFVFSYGLRYVNQTTNYFSLGSEGVYLTRSTSLMPFAGISVRY